MHVCKLNFNCRQKPYFHFYCLQTNKTPKKYKSKKVSRASVKMVKVVKLIEARLNWNLYRSNLCEPRKRRLGYRYNQTSLHPPPPHAPPTHTHLPLFWNFILFFYLSWGNSVARLNCSHHMLISPKSKPQTTSKLTVNKGKLVCAWRVTQISLHYSIPPQYAPFFTCRGYKSHCQSVPCLLLLAVDLLLPSHCAKSFSSCPSNTSHWSLQRGCFWKCWFNSVGKMGRVQLKEEEWQRLLKTTHLLIFMGTKGNRNPSLAF